VAGLASLQINRHLKKLTNCCKFFNSVDKNSIFWLSVESVSTRQCAFLHSLVFRFSFLSLLTKLHIASANLAFSKDIAVWWHLRREYVENNAKWYERTVRRLWWRNCRWVWADAGCLYYRFLTVYITCSTYYNRIHHQIQTEYCIEFDKRNTNISKCYKHNSTKNCVSNIFQLWGGFNMRTTETIKLNVDAMTKCARCHHSCCIYSMTPNS
jgi:hypothetical protein